MKKQRVNKIIVGILALVLFISMGQGIVSFATGSVKNDSSLEISDEKTYSNDTLDDNFADDAVLIVLNKDSSLSFQEFSVSDFPEVNILKVENLTQYTETKVKEQIENRKSEIIELTTENSKKEIQPDEYIRLAIFILCVIIHLAYI